MGTIHAVATNVEVYILNPCPPPLFQEFLNPSGLLLRWTVTIFDDSMIAHKPIKKNIFSKLLCASVSNLNEFSICMKLNL